VPLRGWGCGKIDYVVAMPLRARDMLAGYPGVIAVLAAAALGLSAQRPLGWLAARQGINVLLAVLVFATAVTIEPAALRRLAGTWRPLLAVLAAGVTVLPALSWAVSLLVAAGPLRDGVLALGLAPCEIASVATTAMAGGEAALAAGVLIGSTVTLVAFAGPVLTLEAGGAGVRPGGIIANLALVVGVPLAAGIALGAGWPPTRWLGAVGRALATARAERAASAASVVAVAALVALIAAEVRLSARYAAVGGALVVFLAGSAIVGRLLGTRFLPPAASAVLLTTSMRDFAIAAGLATAAFGPAAAAPLGLYGILILVWGTAVAGLLRSRQSRRLLQQFLARSCPTGCATTSPWLSETLAAERNNRELWELHARLVARQVVPVVPAPVLAQAWRGGTRQTRLTRFLRTCQIEPMSEEQARAIGTLAGKCGHDDIVDVAVVEGAIRRGDGVVTSDVAHIRKVAAVAGVPLRIDAV
jgi:predicted Na+-dependent transporter